MAVFLSLALWLFVFSSSSFITTQNVQLTLLPPSGNAIGNDVPESVEVTIKGPRALTRMFFKKLYKIEIQVDGNINESGSLTVPIAISRDRLPVGLNVVKIVPKSVDVTLERTIKKVVPLKMQYVGEIDSNYRLVKEKLTPGEIMIEGPIGEMRKIGKLMVSPLDVSELEGEGEAIVGLEPVSSKVNLLTTVPIKFEYLVVPRKANLTLTVPIRFLSSIRNIKTSAAVAHLELMTIDSSLISSLKDKIKVVADIPEQISGSQEVELKCELPESIHLLQIRPKYINVSVK